jgi:predicted metal-dependent enzyme (double-stranded beta helix superfamily)/rhodanese-related sulfurtransferase
MGQPFLTPTMQAVQPLNTARLHQFLADLTRLVDSAPPEQELLSQGKHLLYPLLRNDDWLNPELAQPHPQHYQQFLLYADPQDRFSVVSFVWGPGQATPVHDHTVWGLVGMLRGSESCQPYSRMSDGRWVPAGFQVDMLPGDIEAVSPRIGDVHKVWNALPNQVSISIHVYGGNIGKMERHSYREDGSRTTFVSGYSNVMLLGEQKEALWTSPPPVAQLRMSSGSPHAAPQPVVAPVPVATPPLTATPSAAVPPPTPQPAPQPAAVPTAPTAVAAPAPAPAAAPEVVMDPGHPYPVATYQQVRQALLEKQEIALVDVREEDPYAQSHPLFAINLPYGRIECDAQLRIPRLNTRIVLIDNGEGLAVRAVPVFERLGYTEVAVLQNGLAGWAAGGGELFRDVNVPSKAFGELVESQRKTPSFSAHEVNALLERGSDMVVLDARRFDEYQTMSIPGSISVPGGELVLRARSLAPSATTRIVVNCAGRTRSIIGAQSLINAGIPNPVCALRNGTIGWTLAGLELEHKADRRFGPVSDADKSKSAATALALLFRAGVQRIDRDTLAQWQADTTRNTYVFDVRTPEEYAQGHWAGAISAPGGQLVQETDHHVGVRGARLVVYDDDGVRASLTASWLAQMGWEVAVLKDVKPQDLSHTDTPHLHPLPDTLEPVHEVDPATLKEWLANRSNLSMVIDVGDSATYVKRHIPGAWWLLRSQMAQDFTRVHKANRYVLTCADGRASRYAVAELKPLVRPGVEVLWLPGGNAAWMAQGFSTQQGESYVASPRIDRYRRPYEGTNNPTEAMQAYLDWEYGLVEQLRRDGTHHFKVI